MKQEKTASVLLWLWIWRLRSQTTNNKQVLQMRTVLSLTLTNTFPSSPSSNTFSYSSTSTSKSFLSISSNNLRLLSSHKSPGTCQASQVVDLFPTVSPEIVVREARLEDCWEVAETHCSSFFPECSYPLDFVLRLDRLIAMVFGLSVPSGCKRTCLVAVVGGPSNDTFYFGSEDIKLGGVEGKFCLDKGYVAGILTVDTVADFLPRKGPLRQRRMGIAYVSNVAVRDNFRRKGIAKRLVSKAEAQARKWGCRAIALHCDLNNAGATKLYKSQGFKCIKVPEAANWPHPKTTPDIQFGFMMKLVRDLPEF